MNGIKSLCGEIPKQVFSPSPWRRLTNFFIAITNSYRIPSFAVPWVRLLSRALSFEFRLLTFPPSRFFTLPLSSSIRFRARASAQAAIRSCAAKLVAPNWVSVSKTQAEAVNQEAKQLGFETKTVAHRPYKGRIAQAQVSGAQVVGGASSPLSSAGRGNGKDPPGRPPDLDKRREEAKTRIGQLGLVTAVFPSADKPDQDLGEQVGMQVEVPPILCFGDAIFAHATRGSAPTPNRRVSSAARLHQSCKIHQSSLTSETLPSPQLASTFRSMAQEPLSGKKGITGGKQTPRVYLFQVREYHTSMMCRECHQTKLVMAPSRLPGKRRLVWGVKCGY